jgi:hypothetical protein
MYLRFFVITFLLFAWPDTAQAQRGPGKLPPSFPPQDNPTPPVPDARPVPQGLPPHPFAPPCAVHDVRAWHGLWNGELGCHYDHHHGDDPSLVNDLFGTSLFDLMGGTISHPWQTFSELGFENDLKHRGYFWHVRRDLPCVTPGCITAFRVLVHQHPSGRDAAVRFHSAVLEAQVMNAATGSVGYIQIPGMWVDFGHLLVDGVRVIDVGEDAEPGRHKQHGSTGTPQLIWYGATRATHMQDARGGIRRGFASISTSVHDAWDYTAPTDPSNAYDYVCHPNPICSANATVLRPHLLVVHGSVARAGDNRWILDGDGDGVINWQGYADRYGVPLFPGVCFTASLDCVPVTVSGVDVNLDYACDSVCSVLFQDHDIYFGRRTSGWSQPEP